VSTTNQLMQFAQGFVSPALGGGGAGGQEGRGQAGLAGAARDRSGRRADARGIAGSGRMSDPAGRPQQAPSIAVAFRLQPAKCGIRYF
jgi:hypothetical protein